MKIINSPDKLYLQKMNNDSVSDIASMALDFINHTARNVFLTGGAGTGKSTFLKFLKGCTQKKMAIAAPTGVAAVNVGGTTIHSLFALPPRPLDEETVKGIRISSQARLLLRELDLLVVDEVSMLRADVLDAMDYLLKEVRQNRRPLGGLQIVFIGDLFQLPPIETTEDRETLSGLYPTLYFTSSRIIGDLDVLMLELTKVHRQSDADFISLLNAVRTGNISDFELSQLNTFYTPEWADKNSIILTTHNQNAAQINVSQLRGLPGEGHIFNAVLNGVFSEEQFPVELNLQLKQGCRVMVLKNDKSVNPQYYNGKIGTITAFNEETIEVTFDDTSKTTIQKEIWSNITYTFSSETNTVKEEVLGTFQQFPLKLAWSITVHKSQGLTFETAVIDVAGAFAPGQVYVALSRIKTPEGLFLKSKIPASAIIRPKITETVFSKVGNIPELLLTLVEGKKEYLMNLLNKIFDWSSIKVKLEQPTLDRSNFASIKETSLKLEKHASAFAKEIRGLLYIPGNIDWLLLKERCFRAAEYFSNEINSNCISPLKDYIKRNKADYKFRSEVNLVNNIVQSFQEKERAIKMATELVPKVENGIPYFPNLGENSLIPVVTSEAKSYGKVAETNETTEKQTLKLFLAGNSLAEIADKRKLGISAIESHLAFFIPTGEVKITDIIPQQLLNDTLNLLPDFDNQPTVARLRPILGSRLSMGQLLALSVHLRK
ncbi:MAG: AAA family ATPase [Bacteroidetes bacterium]|nr:AAA family ATPase [Bacteroidota bacterium]